jgi:hypothetical protein
MMRAAGDPVPGVKWEVWYRDTFDRECPSSVDVRGRGLVEGLVELWARHLFETVRPGGGEGFSRFHLRCKAWPTVEIEGDWAGAGRLREWVFGTKEHAERGYVAAGDGRLLARVAAVHARLIVAHRSAAEILDVAANARDRKDFEKRLARLGPG